MTKGLLYEITIDDVNRGTTIDTKRTKATWNGNVWKPWFGLLKTIATHEKSIKSIWIYIKDVSISSTFLTEEEILEAYDLQKTDFATEEKRKVEQIVFSDEQIGNEIFKSINKDSNFKEIAKNNEKDASYLNLGTVEKKQLFDESKFSIVVAILLLSYLRNECE